MKILILSSGEHIQGRLILNKLIRNKFSKILLVKEEETKLAKIHDNFLINKYKNISAKMHVNAEEWSKIFWNQSKTDFKQWDKEMTANIEADKE